MTVWLVDDSGRVKRMSGERHEQRSNPGAHRERRLNSCRRLVATRSCSKARAVQRVASAHLDQGRRRWRKRSVCPSSVSVMVALGKEA